MPRSTDERFFGKIEQPATGASCWIWAASRNPEGYGHFFFDGQVIGAHRYSWIRKFGAIPDGLCVLHRCDNPRCVNPEHLFLGTKDDNNQDKVKKGRHTWGNKTHCIRNHPLSGDNLYIAKTTGARICRECLRIRETSRRTTDKARRSDYGKRRVVA